jgi:anti-sigma B factor antagonist
MGGALNTEIDANEHDRRHPRRRGAAEMMITDLTGVGFEAESGVRIGVRAGVPPVIEVCGEIDVLSAPWLRDELLLAVRRHGPRLALDLSGVTFLDCAGINVLLATRRRARLEGGWLQVIRPSARAWRVISLLGLREVLAVTPASR